MNHRSNPELKTIKADWPGTPIDINNRFVNLEFPFVPKVVDVLKWMTHRNPQRKEKKEDTFRLNRSTDAVFLNNDLDCIVWLGHASFFIRLGGVNMLIDPVFFDVPFVKRYSAHAFDPATFKKLDYLLISHDHQDHCQQKSIRKIIAQNPNVVVTNTFSNLFLTGKFFLRKGKLVSPYLSAKAGYSWYKTNLVIEDPEDEDGCRPLDSDRLLVDGTFTASGGAGIRFDFSTIFGRMDSNTMFFDLSAHLTQGGTVQYMNVHNNSHHNQTADSDVTARFINNSTQVVHEHHVGHVYSSLVEMMEYRLGVVFRPSFR